MGENQAVVRCSFYCFLAQFSSRCRAVCSLFHPMQCSLNAFTFATWCVCVCVGRSTYYVAQITILLRISLARYNQKLNQMIPHRKFSDTNRKWVANVYDCFCFCAHKILHWVDVKQRNGLLCVCVCPCVAIRMARLVKQNFHWAYMWNAHVVEQKSASNDVRTHAMRTFQAVINKCY